MSKFASSSVLLLSLIMIAAGKLIPQIAFLGFLAEFANIISIVGLVLLVIFLIASFGLKGLLYFILYVIIFIAVQWLVGFVFGLLDLGGLLYDLIAIGLAVIGTIAIANKIA